MFLGQQSSKNNVKESCVPYVCFAGRHTLKNKCEEQPYVAVQFIIWRKPKVQRFIYICVHHSQKTNIKTSDQIWSNTCVGLNLIKCWFQIFCLGMMCPKKSRKQGFDFCLEGTMVTHSEKKNKEKQRSSTIFSESTEALMPSTKLDQQERNLSWQFDLGKKIYIEFSLTHFCGMMAPKNGNRKSMFSCFFVWKEGYNLEKTQEKHELSLAIVGGMMAIRKNSRKIWNGTPLLAICWGE